MFLCDGTIGRGSGPTTGSVELDQNSLEFFLTMIKCNNVKVWFAVYTITLMRSITILVFFNVLGMVPPTSMLQ